MKSQSFTSLSTVVLLSISLCITELMNEVRCVFEEENKETKAMPVDTGTDVLNPIYIFK